MKKQLAAWLCSLMGAALMASAPVGTARQEPDTNSIALLVLNQPPCTVPNSQSVFKAKVVYTIASREQSEQGFAVSIKFQSTDPRMTFSSGQQGDISVSSRHDTLTLEYPLARVWANPRLKRPLTCYFYLHRNTAPGRSTVIARTPPIVFRECL
ncbi:hypothetical protein MUN81_17165 [Hymenobacter sp. 5317J-9]|uniref:hypothetical protein n=1 Tax=Hymenobacter sp. 5317J-9 TaxID=2932250 RepID=UPI001FD6D38D|nr:hypothetical protein [Hymenobacter sp. 5317J-9]UOQ96962.1 hypothetical protein MUN81_17165 [Hymenobacter sp. 5317J-9]